MNVTAQLVAGVKWVSLSRAIRIGLQYLTLLVLAYFLSPRDFGLMSTAMIFIGFFNLIKDFGFASALIRLEEEHSELLSSVFWLNFMLGCVFSVLIFSSAGAIAGYYQIDELTWIIRALSLSFLLKSLLALPNSLLEKRMRFNTLAKLEIVATTSASLAAIILAYLGYGVWALVSQNIVFAFVLFVLIWSNAHFIPRLVFKIVEIKKVFSFGAHLSGFNVLNYLVRNADYFLIGKFLGMQSLGYYSLAYRIMLFPIQNITSVISRVLYPALAKVKDDNAKAREIFLNVTKSVAFVTFPLMIGYFVVNDEFVTVILADKWRPIAKILYVLVPVGMIQSIYTLSGSIFLVKNKTRLWFGWGIISALVTVTGFYLGLKWGVLGVAVSYLITNLMLMYPGSRIAFNLIRLKFSEYLGGILRILMISLVMGGVVAVLKALTVFSGFRVVNLIILVVMGVVSYLALSYKYNNQQFTKMLKLVKP